MSGLYISALDTIKHKTFHVAVPAYYKPFMTEEMKNPKPKPLEKVNTFRAVYTTQHNPDPYYKPIDHNQLEFGLFTIEIMVDMFKKKVEFQIIYPETVIEIFDTLDRYLITLEDDVRRGEENIITYARLVVGLREKLFVHYFRYMKTNPAALEKLYVNNDPKKGLDSVVNGLGIRDNNKVEYDPLMAKKLPPFNIEAIRPKAVNESNLSQFEKTLGLPTGKPSGDDISTFDFETFMR